MRDLRGDIHFAVKSCKRRCHGCRAVAFKAVTQTVGRVIENIAVRVRIFNVQAVPDHLVSAAVPILVPAFGQSCRLHVYRKPVKFGIKGVGAYGKYAVGYEYGYKRAVFNLVHGVRHYFLHAVGYGHAHIRVTVSPVGGQ